MSASILEQYGMTSALAAEAAESAALFPARIISQEKGFYRAICAGGELTAELRGRLLFSAETASDLPAVGDFVMLDRDSDKSGSAIISRILKRKSVFRRKAAGKTSGEQVVAANIDTVFLCMSLNADFNLHRLERYLSLTWESGAVPVVVLTKSDLCDDLPRKLCAVDSVALGADVLVTTSMEQDGWLDIKRYIRPGQTVALLGSSGVGKSTLINRLLGDDVLETSSIRDDDKGRHTTTRRQLILLPDGGIVIDTPGMRELGMFDTAQGLDKSFADVEEYFGQCRFTNCTHTSEPGCAVWAAIERGELSLKRWESYKALKTEAAYADDRAAYLVQKEKKFKDIARVNKQNKKR